MAKTVVDGFIAGLHRSPDFGFSQEFAEYRAYTPGDDLRHVDWNVFARTERMYLKRYRGETNCQVTVLLDTSRLDEIRLAQACEKLEYAQVSGGLASLYLAHLQRDAAGLIVFDDEVRNFVPPSTRQGQLHAAAARRSTGASGHAHRLRAALRAPAWIFCSRRGMVAVISDFWEAPEKIIETVSPLRFRGNEVVLFHLLDPEEIRPKLKHPVLLEDLETGETMEVSPDYAAHEYRDKMSRAYRGHRERAPRPRAWIIF